MLHAFTGCDTTGKFNGKGKLSCWKAFLSSSDDVFRSFSLLGSDSTPLDDIFSGLQSFVCRLYDANCQIADVGQLRWRLFRKNQDEGHKLPPTRSALYQTALRAQYQAIIWAKDTEAVPSLPALRRAGPSRGRESGRGMRPASCASCCCAAVTADRQEAGRSDSQGYK